ncbi:Tn3 family transposase [Acrocarpospora phusangensis]|uniref:Tn3 family transposase n=1 Tax=Acrocarpospora phusangensis TaxID=1070424 RepID=UPI0023B31E18|nr:Tn3 family transposase [Acrocarpospora phusangensis]
MCGHARLDTHRRVGHRRPGWTQSRVPGCTSLTDAPSHSDMVFGLLKILGYNFSPRLRDLDDQRF